LILELPDVESFIAEAREAGATRVYVVRRVEFGQARGLRTYRAKLVVTAAGLVSCHQDGRGKALLRFEKDFGPVPEDLAAQGPPERYRQKVDAFAEETRAELTAAGFEVRDGEITAV